MKVHFISNLSCTVGAGKVEAPHMVHYKTDVETYNPLSISQQRLYRQNFVRMTYSLASCNYNLGKNKQRDITHLGEWSPETYRTYKNAQLIFSKFNVCPRCWILKHDSCSGGTGIIEDVSPRLLASSVTNKHITLQKKISTYNVGDVRWSLRYYMIIRVAEKRRELFIHPTPLIRFASSNQTLLTNIRQLNGHQIQCDPSTVNFVMRNNHRYLGKICSIARRGLNTHMSECFRPYAFDTIVSRGGQLFVTEVQRSPQMNGNNCTDGASEFMRNILKINSGQPHTFVKCTTKHTLPDYLR